jgi:hypothetical protein
MKHEEEEDDEVAPSLITAPTHQLETSAAAAAAAIDGTTFGGGGGGADVINEDDLKLRVPSGIIISGPSSSGKTQLLLRLLENHKQLFSPQPIDMLYAYGEYHKYVPVLEQKGIHVHSGVPSIETINGLRKPALIILDDLLLSLEEKYLANLFTKHSHHQNYSIILVTQNLFDKIVKVPRLNSMYIFLMRAPNSQLSIRNLGTQIYPKQIKFFLDAYNKATSKPYGYLMVDLHPSSKDIMRLRTDIFPNDQQQSIFLPNATR